VAFLSGFSLHDAPTFDDWILPDGRPAIQACSALQRLASCYTEQGKWENAIKAPSLVVLDPLQDEPHRSLMRLYAWQGSAAPAPV
jgi:DNA-binding SARP family transcriptional activator